MQAVAESQEVQCLTPKTLEIHRLDENGAEVTAGKSAAAPDGAGGRGAAA